MVMIDDVIKINRRRFSVAGMIKGDNRYYFLVLVRLYALPFYNPAQFSSIEMHLARCYYGNKPVEEFDPECRFIKIALFDQDENKIYVDGGFEKKLLPILTLRKLSSI